MAREKHADAMKDHDMQLKLLLERCRDVRIKLNGNKMKLRQKSVMFLGHRITDNGLMADPEKVPR